MHATIHVFTYKAGLLARVAHDLRLSVQRHELVLERRHLRGYCAADSLAIDGVMSGGHLDPNVLSDKDQRQILETIRKEILLSDQYPRVEIDAEIEPSSASSPTRFTLRGTLRLRGQQRPIAIEVVRNGDTLQTAFELTPSEFGIAPYKALAGAIKLQDRVRVSVDLALDDKGKDQSPENLIESAQPVQL